MSEHNWGCFKISHLPFSIQDRHTWEIILPTCRTIVSPPSSSKILASKPALLAAFTRAPCKNASDNNDNRFHVTNCIAFNESKASDTVVSFSQCFCNFWWHEATVMFQWDRCLTDSRVMFILQATRFSWESSFVGNLSSERMAYRPLRYTHWDRSSENGMVQSLSRAHAWSTFWLVCNLLFKFCGRRRTGDTTPPACMTLAVDCVSETATLCTPYTPPSACSTASVQPEHVMPLTCTRYFKWSWQVYCSPSAYIDSNSPDLPRIIQRRQRSSHFVVLKSDSLQCTTSWLKRKSGCLQGLFVCEIWHRKSRYQSISTPRICLKDHRTPKTVIREAMLLRTFEASSQQSLPNWVAHCKGLRAQQEAASGLSPLTTSLSGCTDE